MVLCVCHPRVRFTFDQTGFPARHANQIGPDAGLMRCHTGCFWLLSYAERMQELSDILAFWSASPALVIAVTTWVSMVRNVVEAIQSILGWSAFLWSHARQALFWLPKSINRLSRPFPLPPTGLRISSYTVPMNHPCVRIFKCSLYSPCSEIGSNVNPWNHQYPCTSRSTKPGAGSICVHIAIHMIPKP